MHRYMVVRRVGTQVDSGLPSSTEKGVRTVICKPHLRARREHLPLCTTTTTTTPRVDMVLTGADAVVENGGIINKLGTYGIALAAQVGLLWGGVTWRARRVCNPACRLVQRGQWARTASCWRCRWEQGVGGFAWVAGLTYCRMLHSPRARAAWRRRHDYWYAGSGITWALMRGGPGVTIALTGPCALSGSPTTHPCCTLVRPPAPRPPPSPSTWPPSRTSSRGCTPWDRWAGTPAPVVQPNMLL